MPARRPSLLALFRHVNLRLPTLLASLVVIVFAGYVIMQQNSADAARAFRELAYSQEVRAAVHELSSTLHELQTSAFAFAEDPSPQLRLRYDEAKDEWPAELGRVRQLTLDNPAQQERLGMLRARIEERAALAAEVVAGRAAPAALAAAFGSFTVRHLSEDLIKAEEALIAERQAAADKLSRRNRHAMLAVILAQILLLGSVIVASEIQTRRRLTAEKQAREAEAHSQLIVEAVREPLAVIDPGLGLLQANQAFADFYGIERPANINLADIGGWEDAGLRQRLRDVILTSRELWDYEASQYAAGAQREVLVNARPLVLPGSDTATALLTVSDQTARKRFEDQVLELNRQLAGKVAQVSEVNRELEAFSYSVSHDLRAPLRHISGFADKLGQEFAGTDDKARHYTRIISDSARHMSALIEDLLSYSRLGRHALRLRPVDMQTLVDEVRSTLMTSVEEREIIWKIAPLPVVVADASMLRLVWQNLLENAIKYSGDKAEAVIEVWSEDTEEERVFHVRDNGAGFDMKYVDKLFGVFQRLHKASLYPGSGIGLASVRRIIARHGGRTWAEGETGAGATVSFSLPHNQND